MRHPRGKRCVVLSTTSLLAALTALSCDSEEALSAQVEAEGIPPHCEAYVGDPEIFGYCLTKLAGGFPSEGEMKRLCAMAGEMEGECRHAWVAGRMKESGYTTDGLLDTCGENPDCAFELLDARWRQCALKEEVDWACPDLLEQLSICRRYTGPHHADCAGHAAQRWWQSSPGEAELMQMAATQTDYPDKVGWWIGVSVECEKAKNGWTELSCDGALTGSPGSPGNREFCETAVRKMQQDPLACPQKTARDMHQGARSRGEMPALGQHGRQRSSSTVSPR